MRELRHKGTRCAWAIVQKQKIGMLAFGFFVSLGFKYFLNNYDLNT